MVLDLGVFFGRVFVEGFYLNILGEMGVFFVVSGIVVLLLILGL